jgi:hypothetical protein
MIALHVSFLDLLHLILLLVVLKPSNIVMLFSFLEDLFLVTIISVLDQRRALTIIIRVAQSALTIL